MTNLMTTLSLAALLALPLAGGATTVSIAGTVNEIDFVCYDQIQPDGSEEIVCEDATLVAEECELTDPDGESSECRAVQESRPKPPKREWVAPASLSEPNSDNGGGTQGGGSPGGKRTLTQRN